MATMEELLAAENGIESLSIDILSRKITVPDSVKNIGVESDDDVLRLPFTMPRYIGDVDLSTFDIRINYVNAKAEGDLYIVDDAAVNPDAIDFTWLVGRHATAYKGMVSFVVCLRKLAEDGVVEQEFNTTVCALPVLEGLETEAAVIAEVHDILGQFVTRDELEERLRNFDIGDVDVDVSGKEDKTNKVTSIDDESTHEQYPSAKAAYTFVVNYLRAKGFDNLVSMDDVLDYLANNATSIPNLNTQTLSATNKFNINSLDDVYVLDVTSTLSTILNRMVKKSEIANGLSLVDRTTGAKYEVYIDNGKLTMKESEE